MVGYIGKVLQLLCGDFTFIAVLAGRFVCNDAAVAEMMIKVLPEIARSVAQPLSSIDKVSIIGGDASGVSGVSGNVPVLMAQTMEAMKEATGIDMRDIVRANSIEAKTDRNITIKTEPEDEE